MEPLPAPATRNIFYSQGNIISHPTNTTAAAAKNPCLFLFCITFNICGTRALRSDTCVRARWRCYREIPPPPKYLQATAGAGVCQVQKFVGAGAGYICGPNYSDIGAYVQRVRDTWSAGAGGSVSMTHVPDIGRD